MPHTGMHLKQQQVIKSQSKNYVLHRSSQHREEYGEAARGSGKQRAVQDY